MLIRLQTSDIKRAGRDAGPHYFLWWRPRVSRGARHFTALKAYWKNELFAEMSYKLRVKQM